MLIALLALGLVCGSFINALVWRLKAGESILKGRSHCDFCAHKLNLRDLIPVFSWLVTKGRCRYCAKSLPVQYPLVEGLTALVFAWSYAEWQFAGWLTYLDFGVWLVMVVGLVAMAVYDLKWLELPNSIMYALIGLATAHLGLVWALSHSLSAVGSRLLAAVTAGLFFYSLYFLGRGRWMGGGDVKLAFLMGLILGSQNTLVAMLLGFNVAAIVSLSLMAAKKLKRKDAIPFGPFLIGATIVAMLYGTDLFNAYLRLFNNGY